MRSSDLSSDVCSSDLFSGARASGRLFYACALLAIPLTIIFGFIQIHGVPRTTAILHPIIFFLLMLFLRLSMRFVVSDYLHLARGKTEERRRLLIRSEEHTSELQSLMRISYAVFCLKKKKNINH